MQTVGDLRKAMDGVSDDTTLAFQVVATNGQAWNMRARFCKQVPMGNIACLTLSHPELRSLKTDRTFLFFYEGDKENDKWSFTITAAHYEEAYKKAHEACGPQVDDMMFKIIEV